MGNRVQLPALGRGPADTMVGLHHFLGDRVPRSLDEVAPKPLKHTPFRQNGLPLVSKVTAGKDLPSSLRKSVDLIGGLGNGEYGVVT